MKKFTVSFIMFFTLIPALFAQGIMIGPELGYFKAQDADGSVLFGAQARLQLNDLLSIEGAIDYKSEKYNNDMVDVTSYPVQVTALIYPIPIAYGAIGAGWYNTNYSVDFPDNVPLENYDETTSEFGYHFGGGVQLPIGDKAAISGDIRYVFLNYDFEKIPGQEVDANFFVIKASILFKL